MGFVHHAQYFVWFELGRTEVMRSSGLSYREAEDELGVFFPIIEAGACFRRAARYDEELAVRTTIRELSGLRVRFEYQVVRPGSGELLAEGFTVHVAIDRRGRARRVPPAVRERLAAWLS